MSKLSTIDMKLIDTLFGMYSGWVLDFSNSRFEAFFKRDIGINIYDDAYAVHGASKGKRLRAFLELGQAIAIIRALTALWEYREAGRMDRGEEETVPNAKARLSAVIVKLGGKALVAAENEAPGQTKTWRPEEAKLADLQAEFLSMHGMDDAPQQRGYAFERFLKKWFDTWGLDARGSFKLKGEQIDGSFTHRNTVYLMEAKWRNSQTDAASLRSFQELVGDRLEGSRGLYISYAGFTSESLAAFLAKRIVLMDGNDVYEALHRRLSLDDIVAAKLRIAVEERRPLVHVRELFPA